jgi:aryl-alcohol dehydrogenase-like predicted oxidoreductase
MLSGMHQRTLGSTGPAVSALGLGAMGMSDLYGPSDESESIATIHAALDAGVTLIDTGDFYGSGHNELLIARALRDRSRDAVQLSVKFGALRDPDGGWGGYDGRPAAVRNFLAQTLTRLGTDHVDVYRPARLDPAVPIEETVGAIAELVQAGHVRHIGLSEVGADTIRRAAAVHPIADVQLEYSLLSRGIEREILPTTRELGIGVTAYGVPLPRAAQRPLEPAARAGSGRLPGVQPALPGRQPRPQPAARRAAARGRGRARGVRGAGGDRLGPLRGDDVVPLVGARRATGCTRRSARWTVELAPSDLARIEEAAAAGAAAGARYAEVMMAELDSERPAA